MAYQNAPSPVENHNIFFTKKEDANLFTPQVASGEQVFTQKISPEQSADIFAAVLRAFMLRDGNSQIFKLPYSASIIARCNLDEFKFLFSCTTAYPSYLFQFTNREDNGFLSLAVGFNAARPPASAGFGHLICAACDERVTNPYRISAPTICQERKHKLCTRCFSEIIARYSFCPYCSQA